MSGEFDFIELIRERAARCMDRSMGGSADLSTGIGDDAAIIVEQAGRETLLTVDLLVEDIDFRLEYAIPRWLGHKALAVSLSDVASMGGKPRFALLTLGIPPALVPRAANDHGYQFWEGFFDGYFELAGLHQVTLIGGDISATPERLTIDSFLVGHCQRGKAIRRNGAKVGESIYVTGELGGSAVGLRMLLSGERAELNRTDLLQSALCAHLAPVPRVDFGRLLGESQLVSAMIDVSDGLTSDLAHICMASGVGAIIDYTSVPLSPMLDLVEYSQADRFEFAIGGGEDFELLFTAPAAAEDRLRELAGPSLRLSRIGKIVGSEASGRPLLSLEGDGPMRPLNVRGFNHFSP